MDNYINPPDMPKEQFLKENGKKINRGMFEVLDFDSLKGQELYHIVLVDNGQFTAALICDTKNEYEYVLGMIKTDERPLSFYTVPIDSVKDYI